ncbi:MAG: hypothetical protein ABSH56_18215 [Bryobacteraceae bacterium]|jgi:hypothetical protein
MFPRKEFDALIVAFDLGEAAVNQAVDRLERVGGLEKRRREEINAAEVTGLGAELALRVEERDELRAEMRRTPRPDPVPRRSRTWYVAVALVLSIAGFSFAHLALSPFALGWQVWPYSAALAVVCAYATDETLEKCNCRGLVVTAAVASLIASLAGLIVMALVRGDVLALYLRSVTSAALADSASGAAASALDAVRFYETATRELQLFFALLAVAMELATGLAVYEARKIGVPPATDALALMQERLRFVEGEMVALLRRIEFLKREADIFEHLFTRDFYLGLIEGAARRAMKRAGPMAGALLLLYMAAHRPALAQSLDAAVGIDLSLTSTARNYDGSLEHAKNVDAAAELIGGLPAAARFRVIGITDQSFSRPLVLLAGRLPKDHGPLEFIDQVAVARRRSAADMRSVGRATPATYRETDVIGFLLVAADLLREFPQSRRALVIFSDMRHSAPPPNIELPAVIPVAAALRTVERRNQVADLRGVDVYVYGVHAAHKDVAYWQSLRTFWARYFAESGAALKCFSVMRDVADFGGMQQTVAGR